MTEEEFRKRILKADDMIGDYLRVCVRLNRYLKRMVARTKSTEAQHLIGYMSYELDVNPTQAQHEDGFQEYDFINGSRVPHNYPVGFEIDGELTLFADIVYSDTPYTEEELGR